jgi:hypothetical protein
MNDDKELKTADRQRDLEKLLAYVTRTLTDPSVYCLVVDPSHTRYSVRSKNKRGSSPLLPSRQIKTRLVLT